MTRILLSFFLLAAGLLPGIVWVAQTDRQLDSIKENSLKAFLQNYAKGADQKATTYTSAFVDLKSNGTRQAIVYLSGDGWCGSGGCTTLVLTPEASSYKLVTKISVTRLPIRILKSAANGWHDIAVQVSGGGILGGYEADLSFDGKTYPANPTVPPAQRLKQKADGQVAIPDRTEGKALYP